MAGHRETQRRAGGRPHRRDRRARRRPAAHGLDRRRHAPAPQRQRGPAARAAGATRPRPSRRPRSPTSQARCSPRPRRWSRRRTAIPRRSQRLMAPLVASEEPVRLGVALAGRHRPTRTRWSSASAAEARAKPRGADPGGARHGGEAPDAVGREPARRPRPPARLHAGGRRRAGPAVRRLRASRSCPKDRGPGSPGTRRSPTSTTRCTSAPTPTRAPPRVEHRRHGPGRAGHGSVAVPFGDRKILLVLAPRVGARRARCCCASPGCSPRSASSSRSRPRPSSSA